MAAIRPFAGIRYSPEHVRLGGVLAPPYDVITPSQLEALYGRDLRNITRVDFGMSYPDDEPGVNDRYTRAAGFVESWLELGVLVRDEAPSLYLADHEFHAPEGAIRHRRGVLALVRAVPWEQSELRPHERTLREPKEDRLQLLRATGMQTSPVFAIWKDASGIDDVLTAVVDGPPLIGGRTDGEFGSEKHLLWRVDDPGAVERIEAALQPATLYVADGHHRYETAVAYAAQRRAEGAPGDAPSQFCLVYLAASDDPALAILPTHRLIRRKAGIAYSLDDLWARLSDEWDASPSPDLDTAFAEAGSLRRSHHAYAVAAPDGSAVLRRPRAETGSPRERLDTAVLEREVLLPAGLTVEDIAAGALAYTRDVTELKRAVSAGEAALAFAVQPVTPAEVMAVADAGETMPQKSTYFYPKVPTGLVLYQV
jgi:uncharacterized protein (DUF1015 family)